MDKFWGYSYWRRIYNWFNQSKSAMDNCFKVRKKIAWKNQTVLSLLLKTAEQFWNVKLTNGIASYILLFHLTINLKKKYDKNSNTYVLKQS